MLRPEDLFPDQPGAVEQDGISKIGYTQTQNPTGQRNNPIFIDAGRKRQFCFVLFLFCTAHDPTQGFVHACQARGPALELYPRPDSNFLFKGSYLWKSTLGYFQLKCWAWRVSEISQWVKQKQPQLRTAARWAQGRDPAAPSPISSQSPKVS